jgi:predicted DNA-binding transcriptional regulator AlpA
MVQFAGLKQAGIVNNRVTLDRWRNAPDPDRRFPDPVPLGPNSIAWFEDEVLEWLAKRCAERTAKEAQRRAKGVAMAEARAARRGGSR